MVGLGEEVQAAVDHLHGNSSERLIEGLGYGISQVNQDGIQQPGGPQLELDTILRTDPEAGHAQQAFDDGVGVFDAPALPV